MSDKISCPICERMISITTIQRHADRCLYLSSPGPSIEPVRKKAKNSISPVKSNPKIEVEMPVIVPEPPKMKPIDENKPLSEQMRPKLFDEYIGQSHVLAPDKLLRQLIDKLEIPSMILWGPPGCGKTSLAHLISCICEREPHLRFVKLSATMSGVNDVKEIIKIAKNELKFKRKTVLFMDEIHRFNKLQQDTFLPHIESGTIVLIGATTENPSFSLNSALLSRCRVVVLEKLNKDDIMKILSRAAVDRYNATVVDKYDKSRNDSHVVENETLEWLAGMCDGDARIALNSLQIAIQSKQSDKSALITLDDIKDGIKRTHILYDRKGDEHYNIISALHKSIRASDDNAALYWLTRMLEGGEDPLYIARRLIRIAGEDIGLANPKALNLTVACMQACQLIGMPECDVLLAECAVYLARSPKSTEVYHALLKCKQEIKNYKGEHPSVPLHLRNAPTKLMKDLGYGKGYNTSHKDDSNLIYLPETMKDKNFFT